MTRCCCFLLGYIIQYKLCWCITCCSLCCKGQADTSRGRSVICESHSQVVVHHPHMSVSHPALHTIKLSSKVKSSSFYLYSASSHQKLSHDTLHVEEVMTIPFNIQRPIIPPWASTHTSHVELHSTTVMFPNPSCEVGEMMEQDLPCGRGFSLWVHPI